MRAPTTTFENILGRVIRDKQQPTESTQREAEPIRYYSKPKGPNEEHFLQLQQKRAPLRALLRVSQLHMTTRKAQAMI